MLDQATGAHFNLKGHCISDEEVVILEKIHSTDEAYRKEREKMYINAFNTGYKGINRQKRRIIYISDFFYFFWFSHCSYLAQLILILKLQV